MNSDSKQVVDTIVRVYAAVKAHDQVTFMSLLRDDFLLHENGEAMDARGIFGLVVEAQLAGVVFEWSVVDPIAYIDGNLASLAYRNRGALTRAGVRQAVEWLESATLLRAGGQWKVAFMTSMRDNRFRDPLP